MELQERIIDIKENPMKYIKGLAMDIIVVLVAIAYVFYGMVKLEPNYTNPFVLIAQAAMGIICGVVIKQSLGENGFSKGYNSQTWQEEAVKYNDACNTANDYMDRVDNFYLNEEIKRKRNYRVQHLQAVRLKYTHWFDFEGNYIGVKEEFDKLSFAQKRVLKKCVRVKIYVLNLFSEYATSTEQDTKKEMTDTKKRAKNITKNTVSATLIAIIGVYFIPLFDSWSWGKFASSTMQVALWCLLGVLQLYKNFAYVTQEKVAILKKKKEMIKRFTSGCEKGLYKENPYDIDTQTILSDNALATKLDATRS